MSTTDRLFVITGGPGSGKSTLVAALAAEGIAHMPEAGRTIIRDQLAIGGTALPWCDPSAFAEQMLGWELRSYRAALALEGPVVFDRGIPDVAGYLRLSGLPVPEHVAQAAARFRYHQRVFVAPPWQDIFRQDAERRQSWETAQATFAAMVDVYTGLGYALLPLPLAPIEERVRFVRDLIA